MGWHNSIYFMVFSTAKFYEVYFNNKKYLAFNVFPLRLQMILKTQFKGIGAFCKRKGPAGDVGGSSYTKAKRIPLLKFPRMSLA